MSDIFAMISWSLITVLIWMTGLWFIYLGSRNAGIVDIGWALSFILTMSVSAIIGDHFWAPAGVLALMVYIWGFRLAGHLLERLLTTPGEDSRYIKIKEKWGPDPRGFKFLGMFLLQGFLVVILSIPFYLICADPNPYWQPIHSLALLIWIVGFAGETIADQQLAHFKSLPNQEAKVCTEGLWSYSRHPNYFFEWTIWISYALFASVSPGGLWAWISPLSILYLLLKVSGIPLSEEQAFKTKGEAYRLYQLKTSPFIPWPPKR